MSDLFAFPSRREELGMAALEAMAVGLPLLTSNIHGIKIYLEENVTGYKEKARNYIGYVNDIIKCMKAEQALYDSKK